GRRRGVRFAQMIHRVGRGERGVLVEVNEGPGALARGIGKPGETFLDQFARGGASSLEVGRQSGEGRVSRHDRRSLSLLFAVCHLLFGAGKMSTSSNAQRNRLR